MKKYSFIKNPSYEGSFYISPETTSCVASGVSISGGGSVLSVASIGGVMSPDQVSDRISQEALSVSGEV